MMKSIKDIYNELSVGTLTQQQALESIRQIKLLGNCETDIQTIFAAPGWESAASLDAPAQNILDTISQRQVVLCDFPSLSVSKIRSSIDKSGKTTECLHLASIDADISERYQSIALKSFEHIQTVLKSRFTGKTLVQFIINEPFFLGLSGLLKTAVIENPQYIFQLVLTDGNLTENGLAAQLQDASTNAVGSVLKYSNNQKYSFRWKEYERNSTPSIVYKDNGVYLITGGLGGLGTLFAKEILKQTSKAKIIFTGRSELTREKQAKLSRFILNKNHVEYHTLDLKNRDSVEELVKEIQGTHGQISGIFHSAGMFTDNFIIKKTSSEFSNVLQPKVLGTRNLDLATASVALDFFVMFSSAAAWLGNQGQADYATANGFMDQYSDYRNTLVSEGKRNGRTLTMNWPLWEEGGMVLDKTSTKALQSSTGIHPLPTSVGMDGLSQGLEIMESQTLVMRGDARRMRETLVKAYDIYGAFNQKHHVKVKQDQAKIALPHERESLSIKLLRKTEDFIVEQFSLVLKIPSHKISANAQLENYGIDSLMAMNLTSQLEKSFGSLPKTLFFEYQTIAELSVYFVDSHQERLLSIFTPVEKNIPVNSVRHSTDAKLRRKRKPQVQSIKNVSTQDAAKHNRGAFESIAIVGLSGRYPESESIPTYWENLQNGKDCIVEVPKSRWDWQAFYSEDRTVEGRHYSKWGGFISGVDEFDPRFFNIAPREAESIDPQERLFLQHAWMAVEDGGYTRKTLQVPHSNDASGQVGVYVGVMYGEYNVAGSLASIANRVSYVLNLHGPSITLDTMCSSSLTAIHLACQDLKQGRTDLGIAGGVNVSVHPGKYLMLSEGQFISSDGHCQSFGDGGDGYIPGEGVGAILLKRLSDAQKDGDNIYGVIKGSSLNHGGKTNGYSVPNLQAQANAITRALDESGVDARHVSYIEAHGTGTKLGDPIEIAALTKAFHAHTKDTGFCLLGSAKSNIGHCESAAGMAGLTKVLLQMKHKKIVPSLHSEKLNPHIDFGETPFTVNQDLKTWVQPVLGGKVVPRIAGLSSFGAGGSNAHLIIEEYSAAEESHYNHASDEKSIIVLSARTAAQLSTKVEELHAYLSNLDKLPKIEDIAYTLQTGREDMDERLGLLVTSTTELIDKLALSIAGDNNLIDIYKGQVKNNKDAMSLFSIDSDLQQTLAKWIGERKHSKILDLWARGIEINWGELYSADSMPGKVSLPAYPFAKEHYWVDPVQASVSVPLSVNSNIHPLLHVNSSDLNQHSYKSIFSGSEPFIQAHPLLGENILSTAACIEMVRVAVMRSTQTNRVESRQLRLSNIHFSTPVLIDCDAGVNTALFSRSANAIGFEIYGGRNGEEVVNCQGIASYNDQSPVNLLDLAATKASLTAVPNDFDGVTQLYAGQNEWLLALAPSARKNSEEIEISETVLDPITAQKVFIAISRLVLGGHKNRSIANIDRVEFLFPCMEDMYAWVRLQANDKYAVDLCDAQGNSCIVFVGVEYYEEDLLPQDKDVPSVLETLAERDINILDEHPIVTDLAEELSESAQNVAIPLSAVLLKTSTDISTSNPRPSEKPNKISLVELSPLAITSSADAQSVSVSVENTEQIRKTGEARTHVQIFYNGNGIFSFRMKCKESGNTLSQKMIEELLHGLEQVRQEETIKVLVIEGDENTFLAGGLSAHNKAIELGLYKAIISFPYPVIASVQAKAKGAGFVLASLCDFMVCSLESVYGYTDENEVLFPSQDEYNLFKNRFGNISGEYLLDSSALFTGEALKGKGFSFAITQQNKVSDSVDLLAKSLSNKSQESLSLLKQHLARALVPLVDALVPQVEQKREEGPTSEQLISFAKLFSNEKQESLAEIEIDRQPNLRQSLISFARIFKGAENGDIKDKTSEAASNSTIVFGDSISFTGDVPVVRLNMRLSSGSESEYLESLRSIFEAAVQKGIKTLALLLNDDMFDSAALNQYPENYRALLSLITESPVNLVAGLEDSPRGFAWLVAQYCDRRVYSLAGHYSVASIAQFPEANIASQMAFEGQFSRTFLLSPKGFNGEDLYEKAPTIALVEEGQLEIETVKHAEQLNDWPINLLAIKRENKTSFAWERVKKLTEFTGYRGNTDEFYSAAPANRNEERIRLKSAVVSATAYSNGVIHIQMHDRDAKNMFSDDVVEGLTEVFKHVSDNKKYKSVVLQGYDNYFSSGGTKEGLLSIQEGKAKFTDINIYQLPLNCEIPVIAAMQGHGIGAGWSMGMFADFCLFSQESRYVSPYMNYGFTPGAGSTYMLPEKIGLDIARESLLTAVAYSGKELAARGKLLAVLPRKNVVQSALELADQIARFDRAHLIALKRAWIDSVPDTVEHVYKLELAMHAKTFVGQSDAANQIEDKFIDKKTTKNPEVDGDAHVAESIGSAVNTRPSYSLKNIRQNLRKLLARELHLEEDEVEDGAQFVDLGLDSITGVTWIRKINEKYHTDIEATKVYSYPTLAQLSHYVKKEISKSIETDIRIGGATLVDNDESDISKYDAEYHDTELQNTQVPVTQTVRKTEYRKEYRSVQEEYEEIVEGHSNALLEVTKTLKKLLGQELHLFDEEIQESAQFVDLGLDSITGVTWVRKINDKYKTSIEATKVYSYPTLEKLSDYVYDEAVKLGTVTEVGKAAVKKFRTVRKEILVPVTVLEKASTRVENSQNVKLNIKNVLSSWRTPVEAGSSKTHMEQPIAVVGMAGQFPNAKNIDEFWGNLVQGRDCISEISSSRWDMGRVYQEGEATHGKTYSKWLGVLEDYNCFDPLFFTIAPTEAETMDPQQRVFLEACWHGFENAGYNSQSLSGTKTGVFVGCSYGDYNLISRDQQISSLGFTGGAISILAARIAYILNLKGPCLSIDTACSSSLVAIANACDSLNSKSCNLALAGGVYVMAGPDMHIKTSQTGMLSKDGKCYTFDQRANGFVPGEGVGVVVLKRLIDAERDRDIIHGVIQGWGVNQDGKTNGITAPNAESQKNLIQDVYDKYEINPEKIQLIEAHGTGTKLGDPIEIEGLKESYKKYTKNTNYCAIGSVKSNIGHCLTAAGISGFIKLLLSIKNKQLPPSINFEEANEHIALDGSPFFVNDNLQSWNTAENSPRLAAISAFGFSGTNAHIVLAEHIALERDSKDISVFIQGAQVMVPLSAKNEERLKQKVKDLIDFIGAEEGLSLYEVVYTLQVGRDAMDERIGFMVTSLEDLNKKLASYLSGSDDIDGFYSGQVRKNREGLKLLLQDEDMRETMINRWISQRNLSKIADLWVRGLNIDWDKLYGSEKPQRICLPNYPFARERYWLEAPESIDVPAATPTQTFGAGLHLLLQTKVEGLADHGYKLQLGSDGIFSSDLSSDDSSVKLPQRVPFPTYPFSKQRCWITPANELEIQRSTAENSSLRLVTKMKSIEDIINRIEDENIETTQAVKLLKDLA